MRVRLPHFVSVGHEAAIAMVSLEEAGISTLRIRRSRLPAPLVDNCNSGPVEWQVCESRCGAGGWALSFAMILSTWTTRHLF